MTTTATQPAPPAPQAPPQAEAPRTQYSKDYWDLVFEQLGRNKLFRLSMVILALLYASAIYAPLLANDKPYRIEAVDSAAYGTAHRTMYPAILGLGRLVKQTPEEYEASRTGGSTSTYLQALNAERSAVSTRVETLRSWLPEDRHAGLEPLLGKVDEAIAAAEVGEHERAGELAGEAKDLAKAVRAEYGLADPEQPDAGGVTLISRTQYPLFSSLHPVEIAFMVLWLFVLAWPFWNRLVNRVLLAGNRLRIRKARRTKLAAVVVLSLLAGAGYWVFGARASGDNQPSWKTDISEGRIEVVSAVFPPVPYGFDESNGPENYRPPTFTARAEISEEGFYVRGARSQRVDPVTGFETPAKPIEPKFGESDRNSPWRHVLGADTLGRDMLTRLLWGGRVSLTVGLLSAGLLLVIGTVMGAVAGYFGGWVDLAISRLIEVFLCIPAFPLILMVSAFIDPDTVPPIFSIVVIIALIRWTGVARLVRAEFLRLREAEFAVAAKALGFSSRRTIFKHILPNAFAPALVAGAFAVASGILTESTLSFLGFGIQPPVASWGSLINETKAPEFWWMQVFPGLLIFVTITCYNQVGDAIRDAVDPKMKRTA